MPPTSSPQRHPFSIRLSDAERAELVQAAQLTGLAPATIARLAIAARARELVAQHERVITSPFTSTVSAA